MTKPRSNFLIILILGALSTVSPLAIDMYLSAFPQMAQALGTTPAKISLSLSSYFIGVALGQLIYGPLLDRYGRKSPLYFGLTLFIAASVASMFSPNVETLIALRFLQAIGGCVAQVAAMAMVRDFFPVKDSAKVLSILMLILSVSPLMAPTLGSFITISLGWQWIFLMQGFIVALILMAVFFLLPEGHTPDHSVTLKLGPIARGFGEILKVPQFYTYALSSSFAFGGLLVYVSGSPIIFMEVFKVSATVYGGIFALLSVGFIGGSQLNLWFARKHDSEKLFRIALVTQAVVGALFLATTLSGHLTLVLTVIFIFSYLSCLGIINPNGMSIALAPFAKNAGRASALIGFLQIGIASLASAGVGLFNSNEAWPTVLILFIMPFIGISMLFWGRRNITTLQKGEPEAVLVSH